MVLGIEVRAFTLSYILSPLFMFGFVLFGLVLRQGSTKLPGWIELVILLPQIPRVQGLQVGV